MNQKYPIQSSHLSLLIQTFAFPSNQWGSILSAVTGIYGGRYGVQMAAY
jgi:hypothetical protein